MIMFSISNKNNQIDFIVDLMDIQIAPVYIIYYHAQYAPI